MEDISLKPFRLDTRLTGYLPVPRALLEMNLPSTAILLYGVLLDRATLSRKNHYADSGGWVYTIYPIERLGTTLGIGETSVKRNIRLLEEKGMILRRRVGKNAPNQIYLRLPEVNQGGQKCPPGQAENGPPDRPKMAPRTGQKRPPNNITEQHNKNNYYQHGEDESL